MKKLLGSVLLLAGTAIGSGMLSLPVAHAKYGIFLSSIIMCITTWITYFSSIIRCELNVHSDARFALRDVGMYFSGSAASKMGSIAFKLLSYSLMSAYLYGAASLFSVFVDCNLRIVIVAFALFVAFILFFSANIIIKANKLLFIAMMVILFSVIFCILSQLDFSSTSFPRATCLQSKSGNFLALLSALPILFTSFGFQGSLHSLTKFVDNDRELIKKACLFGSVVPALVYAFWIVCIMLLTFNSAPDLFSKMCAGSVGIDELIRFLTSNLRYPQLNLIIWVISSLALLTSVIGVGIALFDEWLLAFERRKVRIPRGFAVLASVLLPACIAVFVPNAFIKVLNVSGMILAVIAIFLPCFLYFNMVKTKGLAVSKSRAAGILVIILFGILVCISGIADLLG